MSNIILDASALLALFHREEGCDQVEDMLLEGCAMSAVNLAEVMSKHADIGVPADITLSLVQLAGIHVYEFDYECAALVGTLRFATKRLGLSLGDRACLALGLKLNGIVVTADRAWNELDIGINVVLIR